MDPEAMKGALEHTTSGKKMKKRNGGEEEGKVEEENEKEMGNQRRRKIDGGCTVIRGAAGYEAITIKTLNCLNVYNMSRLIKGSHPPRKTVQMQNLSSPKAGSNQGVRKKKKSIYTRGNVMQVIDYTEDYVAEKPRRNRGQKQEARVGVEFLMADGQLAR